MIPVAEPFVGKEEKEILNDVIDSGWISTGKYVELFEKRFADFLGSKYAVSCANGTVALHLALKAIDVDYYNHVLVPDYTFVATAEAAKYCTNKVDFIKCDETRNLDVKQISELLTDTTKAIIPVHLYGNPCEMDKIMKIAKEKELYVVEDACEALGAKYNGKYVGTIGDIGVFSFYGNKMITTGEGGMCVTDDEELYKRMLKLRHHGESKERYLHDEVGFNYRMSNINAAIGVAQMKKLNYILKKKTDIKKTYDNLFEHLTDKIKLQKSYIKSKPINWLYTVEFKSKEIRDKVIKKLEEHNIDTRKVFYPMSSLPSYGKRIPEQNEFCFIGLNLPSSINLTTYEQMKIVNLIEEVLEIEL